MAYIRTSTSKKTQKKTCIKITINSKFMKLRSRLQNLKKSKQFKNFYDKHDTNVEPFGEHHTEISVQTTPHFYCSIETKFTSKVTEKNKIAGLFNIRPKLML